MLVCMREAKSDSPGLGGKLPASMCLLLLATQIPSSMVKVEVVLDLLVNPLVQVLSCMVLRTGGQWYSEG